MKVETARKILCNEIFAVNTAKNMGIGIQSCKREAKKLLNDVRRRENRRKKNLI